MILGQNLGVGDQLTNTIYTLFLSFFEVALLAESLIEWLSNSAGVKSLKL